MQKTIETASATASILSDKLVLVRAKSGVEINQDNARRGDKLIQDAMPGNYGQIIDRTEDYSIAPVEVFQILNQNPQLRAIAIVVHRENSRQTAELGRRLFKGQFAVFSSIEQAQRWLESVLP